MLKNNDLSAAWEAIKNTLQGIDRTSPLRLGVLTTTNGGKPNTRYIVVREVDERMNIWIFTDSRSGKVKDIQLNPHVSLLLYDQDRMIQIIIRGETVIQSSGNRWQNFWNNLPAELQKPYNPSIPPGTVIEQPEDAHIWDTPLTSGNFVCLQVQPEELEILELDGLKHYRAKFMNNTSWQGEWIAP